MSFIEYENRSDADDVRVEFFDFTPGDHTIRVLNAKAHAEKTHWIKNLRIKCLGSECPICKKYPEEYPRAGYFVNVLDLTDVKLCNSCGKRVKSIMGKYPQNCPSCGSLIATVQPQPNNKIVVLSGGKRLFVDQLAAIYDNYGDLRKFDLEMLITGTGRERQIVVRPSKNSTKDLALPSDEELFDLKNIVIRLSPEEMIKFHDENVTLRDIYLARVGKTDNPKEEEVDFTPTSADDIIKSLFND